MPEDHAEQHTANPGASSDEADDFLLGEVERALAEKRFLATFSPAIERRMETDTRVERVRDMRRAILLGLAVFQLYDLSGFVTTPDLGILNLILRTAVMTPTALLILWAIGRVGAPMREALCAFGMLGATAIPILITWLGSGPLFLLAATGICLSVVFANVTLTLRFSWACFISATATTVVAAALWSRADIAASVCAAVMLDLVTGILYSLYATYRIEVARRRDYLVGLREVLRRRRLLADNNALALLSTTDSLTGLSNRRAFTQRLNRLWTNAASGLPFALILIDVDHFKRFNDHHGHGAGDACLREVAGVFAGLVNAQHDLVARHGGEEFVLLLPYRTLDEAFALAERLRRGVANRALPHLNRVDGLRHVTVSLGVAASTGQEASANALVEAADRALYEAKSRGRDQTCAAPAIVGRNRAERGLAEAMEPVPVATASATLAA